MSGRIAFWLAALISGTIFGLGLAVSRMADPNVVLAFLDITGQWNPSLLLTMAGAVAISLTGFRLIRGDRSLLGEIISRPTARQIDRPLLLGAALFGVGWGIAGYCPGPAITGLSTAGSDPMFFVGAMIAGGWLRGWTAKS